MVAVGVVAGVCLGVIVPALPGVAGGFELNGSCVSVGVGFAEAASLLSLAALSNTDLKFDSPTSVKKRKPNPSRLRSSGSFSPWAW